MSQNIKLKTGDTENTKKLTWKVGQSASTKIKTRIGIGMEWKGMVV